MANKSRNTLRAWLTGYKGSSFTQNSTPQIAAWPIINLSESVDSLSTDGQKPQLFNIQLRWHLSSMITKNYPRSPCVIYFGVLQTAGAETDAISTNMLEQNIIAGLTDDVLGFQRISNPKAQDLFWQFQPYDGEGTMFKYFKAAGQITLPGNIVALLNKEAETERLQDLSLVAIVIKPSAGLVADEQDLSWSAYMDYTLRRKNISIR